MAVDGDPATKYLNRGKYNTGIIITPRAASTVASIDFVSANDEWARDPTSFHLYGTNDAITSDANSRGDEENWVVIGTGEIDLPYDRYSSAAIVHLDNDIAYRSYKLIFPTVKGDYDAMQIAEVQFFTSNEEPIFSRGDLVIGIHDAPSYSLMLNAGTEPYYRQPTVRTDMCPLVPGEAYLGGGAGCPDADRDGWADPVNDRPFIEADMCPNNAGEATTPTGRGCPDADRMVGRILKTTSLTIATTISTVMAMDTQTRKTPFPIMHSSSTKTRWWVSCASGSSVAWFSPCS